MSKYINSNSIRANELALILQKNPDDSLAWDEMVGVMRGSIKWTVLKFFAPGMTKDDLEQECYVQLPLLVSTWDPDIANFVPFAKACLRRKMITVFRSTQAKKYHPLNSAMSLDYALDAGDAFGDEITMEAMLVDPKAISPSDAFERADDVNYLFELLMPILTKAEAAVAKAYLQGMGYGEILTTSKRIKDVKAVDNCLNRIKTKARKLAESLELFD